MKERHPPALSAAHQVQLLQGGKEFFPELVRALDQCVHEVRMETYIFNADPSGELVVAALVRAARRGVAVYLVIDGVGTPALSQELAERFDQAGVKWRIYKPLGWVGLLIPNRWRRMHRKLVVVDGQMAFCGGINILDDWVDPNYGQLTAPRFDFAVRVTGPLVRSAHEVMVRFWWRLHAASDARHADFPAAWHDLEEAVRQARPDHPGKRAAVSTGDNAGTRAALLLRDNLRNRSRIERAYRRAISNAREEIIIANAYFVPGHKLRKALIHAAKRGVRVRLLLQGRYEYFMQFHAVRMVYGVLLNAGIEIHEYSPSFLHAKVAVIDGHWATIGSSNLDPLSMLLAREANVLVDDAPFAQDLRERLIRAMEQEGVRVDPASYGKRPWQQRLLDRVAFALMRFGVFLSGNRY